MHTTARDANLLGALGMVVSDALADAAELAGGASPAAALVALHGTSAGGTIDALAGRVGLSHSGAVRLVDRLVRDGLVERRRGADQRSAALVLTPQGRRTARKVLARRDANLQVLLALLTDDQRAAAMELVELLLRAVGRDGDAEPWACRLCDLEACGRSRGRCPVAPRVRRPRQTAKH
ncbi:MAG TPA: MarR family transcriptional regulator [Solirubrobacteraceae bacterium]|nr:MarR family transcriptional regulator [Solirubrobacteraceae bacterium]